MWVPTWGSSRVDVGADVGSRGLGRCDRSRTKTCGEGFTRVRFSSRPRLVSPFLLLERWRFRPVSRANEARSDHDVQAVPAIQCVTSMVREQRYPM